jgi:hypothetical protein
MSPSPADQPALMKEVLETLKTLEANQVRLSSSVDAISGRVNVLAGMKEVRDVAKTTSIQTGPMEVERVSGTDEPHIQEDAKIPESPTLPASSVSFGRRLSTGTSRIILTYWLFNVTFTLRHIILILV